MQLRQFENQDDSKAVWLNDDEISQLLDETTTEEQRFALGVMARSGLRVQEAADVEADDLVQNECGLMIRVWQGKGDKYRETPIPAELFYLGRAIGRDRATVCDAAKRTLQDWVTRAADARYEQTDEIGWSYVSAHDLRRSWGTLLAAGIDPMLVMEYGGWENFSTFRESYLNIHDPQYQKSQREKIDWL
jgi:Phage integrase family.